MTHHEYDLEDDVPALSPRYSDDQSDDSSIESENSVLSSESLLSDYSSSSYGSLENAYVTANTELNDSFTLENLNLSETTLPDFGNPISNTYFEQEYQMDLENGKPFGDIRGIF